MSDDAPHPGPPLQGAPSRASEGRSSGPEHARGNPALAPARGEREASPPRVSTAALFFGFLRVGVSGFGGVLPFARRMLVERERWLTEQEFTEVLSLAQFLPGPNIVNVSVIVGRRFRGASGATAATAGLMLMPLAIVLLLAMIYAQFAQIEAVRNACTAVSAAAAGLVLAMGLKMARPIAGTPWQVGIGVVALLAIGFLRTPLLWTLALLVPLAVAIAWRRRA